ncbi:hypothetical protein ANN_01135 [Periplaneta americana]|uniref:Uncharacterized protein n=1 Tax=Periplaneta americana TaxID=6978 RepID=A0ABQ8TV63_PERAM|nr:hypothetical protein ANN_01135 [Periplaneta americana]
MLQMESAVFQEFGNVSLTCKKKTHLSTYFKTVHIPATTGVTVRIALAEVDKRYSVQHHIHRRATGTEESIPVSSYGYTIVQSLLRRAGRIEECSQQYRPRPVYRSFHMTGKCSILLRCFSARQPNPWLAM